MPLDERMRPAWLIRAGLFLYDHLAKREWLPGTERLKLRQHRRARAAGAAQDGLCLPDGWADDARSWWPARRTQSPVAPPCSLAPLAWMHGARRTGWQLRLRHVSGNEFMQARPRW